MAKLWQKPIKKGSQASASTRNPLILWHACRDSNPGYGLEDRLRQNFNILIMVWFPVTNYKNEEIIFPVLSIDSIYFPLFY